MWVVWWETVYGRKPVLAFLPLGTGIATKQPVAVGRKRIGRLNLDAEADVE